VSVAADSLTYPCSTASFSLVDSIYSIVVFSTSQRERTRLLSSSLRDIAADSIYNTGVPLIHAFMAIVESSIAAHCGQSKPSIVNRRYCLSVFIYPSLYIQYIYTCTALIKWVKDYTPLLHDGLRDRSRK
jgi:hypothetical protein